MHYKSQNLYQKMKKLIYLLLLLPLLTTTSCKKSSGGGDDGGLSSITVTALQDPIYYGLSHFTFRVKGNDNVTYTSSSTFFVDGNQISGNTFDPPAAGTYEVYAKKDNLTSSPITITANTLDLTVEANPNPTYIELDPFEFTATGSNGNNYTSQCTFYVNDNEITGNSFDPDTAGDYQVYAKLNDIIVSPEITATATVGYESLAVTMDNPMLFLTQSVTFTATDNLDRDLSNLATFYVNGSAITGNVYTPQALGDYDVYAVYDGIQSSTQTFTVVASNYTTKVLVEDYTGTWCGYCPRLWWKIEDAVAQNANIIPAAIHDDTEMKYEYAASMESTFNVSGFPTGKINRTLTWDESQSQLNNAQAELVGLGLAINSTRTGNNLDITVKVGFDLTYTEELKLVLYVLEDGLHYDQVNYYNDDASTPVYQLGDPIPNFEYNYVVRKAFTDVYGDVIPSAETVAGGVYTRNFNVAIPVGTGQSDVHDPDNIHLIAFVVKGDSKTAINVQKADIGEDKDFD